MYIYIYMYMYMYIYGFGAKLYPPDIIQNRMSKCLIVKRSLLFLSFGMFSYFVAHASLKLISSGDSLLQVPK
jgi:hypothetical protein